MTRQTGIALAVMAIAMFGTTLISYSGLGEFVFNRGSYVFSIVRAPVVYPLLAATAAVAVMGRSLARPRSSLLKAAALLLVVFWLLCGRVVALSWDGRVAGGWFFMRTHTLLLRDDGQAMDDYAKHWTVRALPGWRIECSTRGRSERLFVGPLIYGDAMATLESNAFRIR